MDEMKKSIWHFNQQNWRKEKTWQTKVSMGG